MPLPGGAVPVSGAPVAPQRLPSIPPSPPLASTGNAPGEVGEPSCGSRRGLPLFSCLLGRAQGYGEVRGRFLENVLLLWTEAKLLGCNPLFCGDSDELTPPLAPEEFTDCNTLGAVARFEVAGRVALYRRVVWWRWWKCGLEMRCVKLGGRVPAGKEKNGRGRFAAGQKERESF